MNDKLPVEQLSPEFGSSIGHKAVVSTGGRTGAVVGTGIGAIVATGTGAIVAGTGAIVAGTMLVSLNGARVTGTTRGSGVSGAMVGAPTGESPH